MNGLYGKRLDVYEIDPGQPAKETIINRLVWKVCAGRGSMVLTAKHKARRKMKTMKKWFLPVAMMTDGRRESLENQEVNCPVESHQYDKYPTESRHLLYGQENSEPVKTLL